MSCLPRIKSIFYALIAGSVILASQISTVAQAQMISTDSALSRYSAHADRTFLLNELQRADVRQKIRAAGVDPAEAERRLRALSDEEVAALVHQIEAGEAGADGGLGTVVGALLTVFVILLVTDLLCLTKALPFTRCAR